MLLDQKTGNTQTCYSVPTAHAPKCVMVKAIHILFKVDHIQDNSGHGLNGEKLNKAHTNVSKAAGSLFRTSPEHAFLALLAKLEIFLALCPPWLLMCSFVRTSSEKPRLV